MSELTRVMDCAILSVYLSAFIASEAMFTLLASLCRQMCVNKIERYFVNENFVYCYDIHNSAYTVKIKACYFLNILKKLLCLCENMHYILRIFLENLNQLYARNSVFFSDITHNYLTFCFQKKCLQ